MSQLKGQSIQVIWNLNGTDLKTSRTALKRCESSVLFRVNSETFQALQNSFLVSIQQFRYDTPFGYNSFDIIVLTLVSNFRQLAGTWPLN